MSIGARPIWRARYWDSRRDPVKLFRTVL